MAIIVERHSFLGGIWMIGWLFTVGYLHLTLIQLLLAIIIWPYYLGTALSFLPH